MSERWKITYVDADGRGQTRHLGTPGAGRTAEEQCTQTCDELRAEGATHIVVDVERSHRTFTVLSSDIRGRSVSRMFTSAAEATAFADEERGNPWISNVAVREAPVVKHERRAVLDPTGRPI